MSTKTQSVRSDQRQPQYIIRYTTEGILINGEPISYGSQILDIEHLYIISAGPQSQLQTPIVLKRTNQVDELDKKIFLNKFLMQIVKAIEICSFEDAVFIIHRVPTHLKYFVGLFQKITLSRWIQLLNSNLFFIALYQTLENLISRKEMSQLRTDYMQEILQTSLKTTYSRLYFLMDNLVLEDQNLRTSIVNLTRLIVLREIQDRNFFDTNLLGKWMIPIEEEENSQNSGIQDNKSETDSIPDDKQMAFPDKLLPNTIQIVKSCQRLKIQKDIITQKVLNRRFYKILKNFFQNFFERQRHALLEILALSSEIQPLNMWRITFEEGRTIRCKSLLYLESLLTNSMISYSQKLRRPLRPKNQLGQNSLKEEKKQTGEPIKSSDCWDFTSVIIEKFITFQSPERKVFLNKILNSLLTCKLMSEQLDFILIYLDSSSKDEIYLNKNMEIWKIIVIKIETWLHSLSRSVERKYESEGKRFKHGGKQKINKTMMINSEQMHEMMSQQSETNAISIFYHQRKDPPFGLKLPMSKASVIKLMKIYKILVVNRKKFHILLDPQCLMYIIDVTEKRKGIIEGARLTLMEVLNQEQSQEFCEEQIYELNSEEEEKFRFNM